MSNERFDKLMKKNLESVRPAYQSQAWDRFRKRLPVGGLWSWVLPYGGWVMSGLMLMGWLMTLYTLRENQQIIQQISPSLAKTAPVSPTSPATHSVPEAIASHRIDTVYIVKKTIVEHRHYYDPTLPDKKQFSEHPSRQQSNPEAGSRPTGTGLSTLNEAVTLQERSGQEQSVPVASLATSSKQPKQASKKSSVRNSPTDQPARNERDSILQAPASTALVAEESVTDRGSSPAADSIDRQPTKSAGAVDQLPTPKTETQARVEPASQHRSPFRLSSLKPRLGIESIATANSIGIGPSIEAFPMDNLGISVGLRASQLRTQSHHGPDDFNAATGKEFIDQYKPYLPANYDRIEDISVRTSLISLPVSINYYVPFHRKWSVLVKAGTRFDVATYQQVYYESYLKGDEQHHSFDTNVQSRFFHNFMFGTGLQYRTSRFSAQLSPYYLYDFRPTASTPSGNNFGLQASVLLDLFK
ncbi:hypothetical protein WBJ53_04315 [Spirosoma sp. SC4-14]|uniref:hypothetical protein n=1 Tax=Spirosoma sp. SC4-14 TaxID=3128900 RepID=UPI0030CB854E